MGVFGPKYPEPLEAVIGHARRLCALLPRLEESHPDPNAWLVGRGDEIALVVRLRLRDWRAKRISLGFAARSIAAYLDDLHTGAVRSLGLPANIPLSCCGGNDAPTVPLGGQEGESQGPSPSATSIASVAETWLDLHSLVDLPATERSSAQGPSKNVPALSSVREDGE